MALWFWLVICYGASVPVAILLYLKFCKDDEE
jgi:hypothetical protein